MDNVEKIKDGIITACEGNTGAEIMSGILAAMCDIAEAVNVKPQMMLVYMMELLQMDTKGEQEN